MYDYNKHVGKIVRKTSLADSLQTQSVCLPTAITNCFHEQLRVNSYTIPLHNIACVLIADHFTANRKVITANC